QLATSTVSRSACLCWSRFPSWLGRCKFRDPDLARQFCSKRGKQNEPEFPSLDKEGWLRPLKKCREASIAGADGVVGSSHRLSEVERTTQAAPPKERDHLLDGAASPPLPRRGLRPFPPAVPDAPYPADDLW